MSIKKDIPFTLLGLALEGGCLLLLHRLGYINLQRINWHDTLIWGFFLGGFFSACWLFLWLKFVHKIFSFKNKKETSTESHPSPTSVATVNTMRPPARMAVQNNAVLAVTPQNSVTNNVQSSPAVSPATATTSQPSQLSQKEQDINMLSTIDSHLDMMAFKHVALDGKLIDLVYSSDDTAVLCKIFSDDHTWTVDTSQSIESCAWQDETGTTQTPCLELLKQAAILEKMESGARIIPTILLVRGSVNNAKEVSEYLLKNQITLAKYNPTDTDHIQNLHDLLQDRFNLFKEDEEESKEE